MATPTSYTEPIKLDLGVTVDPVAEVINVEEIE
jgi:hypothetical protein